ncbi:MAG: peptidylprolyl isomerase [Muribaculaceae bacterium]|nr:peptidylprolyl isomerase [Muribaculaceae bacterium]
MLKKFLSILMIATALTACGSNNGNKPTDNKDSINKEMNNTNTTMNDTTAKYVLLHTSLGDITVMLYGDTPKHQANFLKLVGQGYYNNVLFHRVINQFMIQTGDPDSRDAKPGQMLGQGGPGYQIDAEIVYPRHFHKRGALAAARTADQINPEKKSSGSQFYIVTGKTATEAELKQMAQQQNYGAMQAEFDRLAQQHMSDIQRMQAAGDQAGLNALQQQLVAQVEAKFATQQAPELPAEIKKTYTTVGGTPFLDNAYTVFGEVVSGMDVVDKIEKAQTDSNDRPTQDIRILSAKVIDRP